MAHSSRRLSHCRWSLEVLIFLQISFIYCISHSHPNSEGLLIAYEEHNRSKCAHCKQKDTIIKHTSLCGFYQAEHILFKTYKHYVQLLTVDFLKPNVWLWGKDYYLFYVPDLCFCTSIFFFHLISKTILESL